MAIKATFSPTAGVLSINGDNRNNRVTVSRDAAGNILVNDGAVAIDGGRRPSGDTSEIDVFGQCGQ